MQHYERIVQELKQEWVYATPGYRFKILTIWHCPANDDIMIDHEELCKSPDFDIVNFCELNAEKYIEHLQLKTALINRKNNTQ